MAFSVNWAICNAPGGQIKITATIDLVTGTIQILASNDSDVPGHVHLLNPQGRQFGGTIPAHQSFSAGPLPGFIAVLDLSDPLNPSASIPDGWELGLGW